MRNAGLRALTHDRLQDVAELAGSFAHGALAAARHRRHFEEVERFCTFIGYPRSGHSLVGSLLNAHPEVVIAHERDALRLIAAHMPRALVYGLLMEADIGARGGTRQRLYDYRVPGQWQGTVQRLRVIGDKKGGQNTERLHRDLHMLDRLRRTVRDPLRLLHVVRNPFDNVATMARRRPDGSIGEATERYLRLCRTVRWVKGETDETEVFDLRHEDLVADPRAKLAAACRFLQVEPPTDYLQACSAIVAKAPNRTRTGVAWTPPVLQRLEEACQEFPFLRGYSLHG